MHVWVYRKFYLSLGFARPVSQGGISRHALWELVIDIVAWAKGGINYQDAKRFPISELVAIRNKADKINREIQRTLNK